MRLPDEVPKSVVFLGRKAQAKRTGIVEEKLEGTAFFVAQQVARNSQVILLVTAAHIARRLEAGQFFIRANTKAGSAEDFWLDGAENHWLYHPSDSSIDAAMLLWTPPDRVDYLCLHDAMVLNDERLESTSIGIGDETYVTGLFRFHTGQKRNEPIIRSAISQ